VPGPAPAVGLPLMIRRRGATIGKRARRLTVRMAATGELPTGATWFRFGVPLHDKVAGTVVVKG
jgi:hypothetical protein